MKNILVVGSLGQLGSELRDICDKASPSDRYFFTDKDTLDITSLQSVESFIGEHNIDVVVNCAAYTNVDKAESDLENAYLVNDKAVEIVSEVCAKRHCFFIHISTDYVFDGSKNTPYSETDKTNPISVYGKSKLKGEQSLRLSGAEHIIIRTSWLYSRFGNNFVKTIKRLSKEKPQLSVVFDQVGTPTNAFDLAQFIFQIIEDGSYKSKREIYHFSNEGVCSWFDFATEIVRLSGNKCVVNPCHSSQFPTPVKRPSYSVLDKSKVKEHFSFPIKYWRDSLEACFDQI